MKSKEFDKFYEESLRERIQNLETGRLEIISKFSFSKYRRNLAVLLGGAFMLIVCSNAIPDFPDQVLLIIPIGLTYIIIAPVYIHIKRKNAFSPIKAEYKESVVKAIVEFINPNLLYQPTGNIPLKDFNESDLFDKPGSYTSRDLIQGEVQGVQLRVSGVRATRRTRVSEGHRSSTVNVFSGLFGIANLSKRFKKKIVIQGSILADKKIESAIHNVIGVKATDFIDETIRFTQVKTGNAEFDRYFTIRFEQNSMRQEIDSGLIELLVLLRRELEVPVCVSLLEYNAYFAFSGIDLFEIGLHKSIIENNVSEKHFQCLNLAVGLSRVLNACAAE